MPVLRTNTRDDLAVSHIERREQRDRAVMNVVVSDAFNIAQPHRQHGLRVLQCLDLALLIDAQHQRVIGWIQLQTGDIAHLLDEGWIVRQLEAV